MMKWAVMISEISASCGAMDGAQGSDSSDGLTFRALYKTRIPQDLLTLTINLTGSKTTPETNLWARLWGSFHFGVSEVRRAILTQRVGNHRLWSLSLNKKGNRRNPAEHRIQFSLLPDCGCHVPPYTPASGPCSAMANCESRPCLCHADFVRCSVTNWSCHSNKKSLRYTP